MIVNDFNLMHITAMPDETDAPLVIDLDAVLPFTITMQRLQPISRRNPQGFQPRICGSATPRLVLPKEGRKLIIESALYQQ